MWLREEVESLSRLYGLWILIVEYAVGLGSLAEKRSEKQIRQI